MMEKWPTYEVAPEDAVYAVGVVSINYARFERTHVWMLAAVANMPEEQAAVIIARANASDRVKLIETFMQRGKWPDEALAAITHYLKAMDVLIKSRNVLIYSNIIRGTENRAAIYSMTKQGTVNLFQAALEEVRKVADDLNIYFYFGMHLANYIATEFNHMARHAGMMVFNQLPQPPPLPFHIDPNQRPKR